MTYIVIRLGRYAFPCGASHHETLEEAHAAIAKHGEATGYKVTGTLGGSNDKLTQWTTKESQESFNSYVVVESGEEDNKRHRFSEDMWAE